MDVGIGKDLILLLYVFVYDGNDFWLALRLECF